MAQQNSKCLSDAQVWRYVQAPGTAYPQAAAVKEHLSTCTTCRIWVAECLRSAPPSESSSLDRDPFAGLSFGRYRISERLGEGGQGIAYEALDTTLERRVAIKILRNESDKAGALGAEKEARALAQINHPNVVTVFDFGTDANEPYIAMEFVSGQNVREWSSARRSWREICAVFEQVAHGLIAIHGAGLAHGDIKPENLVVSSIGDVKIIDLGFAHASESYRLAPRGGTRRYASPERMAGQLADAASDQYSFFAAMDDVLRLAKQTPPAWMASLIARGTDSDPTGRFSSMATVAKRLHRGLARRTVVAVSAVAALVVAGAVAASFYWNSDGRKMASRCDGLEGEFATIVTDQRRALATGAATSTQQQLLARGLDAFASDWQKEHLRICGESGDVYQASFERSATCLSVLSADLSGVSLTLNSETKLADTIETLFDLRPPQTCSIAPQLISRPSRSPFQQQYWQTVEPRLQSFRAAGNYKEGAEVAAQFVAKANANGETLVEADATRFWGGFLAQLGKLVEAEEALQNAIVLAEKTNAETTRLQASLALLAVYGYKAKGLEQAMVLARQTKALLDRLHSPPQETLSYFLNVSSLYQRTGEMKKALPLMKEALRIATTMFPAGHPQVGKTLHNLGSTYGELRNWREAKANQQAAVANLRAAFGDENNAVAIALGSLATSEGGLGNHDEAIRLLHQTLEIQQSIGEADHPRAIQTYINLCDAYQRTDRDGAIEMCARGVDLARRVLGEDTEVYTWALLAQGRAELKAGKVSDAVGTLERALAARLKVVGPPDSLDQIRFTLAGALYESKRDRKRVTELMSAAKAGFSQRNNQQWLDQIEAWEAYSGLQLRAH